MNADKTRFQTEENRKAQDIEDTLTDFVRILLSESFFFCVYRAALLSLFVARLIVYFKMSLTTVPYTSVRRKSRPL
ncbi:MAG: hypothetical protein JWO38_8128 [Gemmataceae bacterium]|nr:hypothetical protein [Gemmataceae bacterium]